jgi:hypothetical protein
MVRNGQCLDGIVTTLTRLTDTQGPRRIRFCVVPFQQQISNYCSGMRVIETFGPVVSEAATLLTMAWT